ncbi:MAG: beta-ketoacyl-ACP synthase II [Planctomycetes bacterium]|jgi:3-oxoacyl-[acyl-carrier-protein] synthase II|nr:beta-ketoacyl-ACP synthase II [Planctomycetota bacterium]MCP4241091.1 beta-ketoacyl-ACP synthase [bacterium]MDP6076390.1 beta-ketoacyl-ACP synthase [Myxococcota bacterium]MDP6242118.1 beta-ketoacyl-ACP synthase [Myxococcota bacterium]MDP7074085.1 beta-ketoacyl-ACP synthase [Myxococcota bacterium]
MTRRVVVTGMAGLTSVGLDWAQVRASLRAGRSGVRRIPEWSEIDGLACRVGAPATQFETPEHYPRKSLRSMGRVAVLATRSVELALENARLRDHPALSSGRTGISYGSNSGSPPAMAAFTGQLHGNRTLRGIAASEYLKFMSHSCAANVASFFGIRGRVMPTASACTSGSQGIGQAYDAIRFGQQDVMLAGGADEFDAMDVAVFDVLYAASTRNESPQHTPRPFDADRDGLVVGEGAGCLVLEDLEHARARGVPIHAEVIGYATNCDGRHMTNPDPAGMEEVMRLGLAGAEIEPCDVDYVDAHATGTPAGDTAESRATHAVFGDRIPVSSLKGHLGHTLGACGALEAWITIEMTREGWVAPTLNLEQVDSACAPLDYVQEKPRSVDVRIAMSNNFAFGGINTSLLFQRWDG